MDREIELHADGNGREYRVILEINGREFSCCDNYTQSVNRVFGQVSSAVEDVYGTDLYDEPDKNADIINALVSVENIILELKWLGEEKKDR